MNKNEKKTAHKYDHTMRVSMDKNEENEKTSTDPQNTNIL